MSWLFSYGIPLISLSLKTVNPFWGSSKRKFDKPFKIVLDICMKSSYSKFHRNRSNGKYFKVGPNDWLIFLWDSINLLSPKTENPFWETSKPKFEKPLKIVSDICMKNSYSKFHRYRSNGKYFKVGPNDLPIFLWDSINLLSPKTENPFWGTSKPKLEKPFKIVLDNCTKNGYRKFHRNRSIRKYLKVVPNEISW